MLHIYGATDRGMVRETNEDRFAGEVFDQGSGYAVVCDGMGGEVGGGIAAGIAAEEVRRMIESSLRSHMEERSLRLLLETAIAGANRAVYTRSGQSGGALTGMGSTLCAAVISDGGGAGGQCRRQPLLPAGRGIPIQVTEDHTAVAVLLQQGLLSPEEAAHHPDRHAITRAIGVEPEVQPDYTVIDLLRGDALLLCSDGLYNTLPPGELAGTLQEILQGWGYPYIDSEKPMPPADRITSPPY